MHAWPMQDHALTKRLRGIADASASAARLSRTAVSAILQLSQQVQTLEARIADLESQVRQLQSGGS